MYCGLKTIKNACSNYSARIVTNIEDDWLDRDVNGRWNLKNQGSGHDHMIKASPLFYMYHVSWSFKKGQGFHCTIVATILIF